MATNNSINLISSGIAFYDGAATFSALSSPLTVANGGTGISSATTYAVLCGGTTSTNPIQSIASLGTSGQVLTSNGAGTLPTFQNLSGSARRYITLMTSTSNPADGITYYMSQGNGFASQTSSSAGQTRIYLPFGGQIAAAYGAVGVDGVLGSAQNCTVRIRKNDTTNYTVTSSLQLTSAVNPFNNTTFGSFVAGDFIDVVFVSPTWTTNPTTVSLSITLLF